MKNPSINNSTTIKRRSTTVLTECKICKAPATYSYFGAISCGPCKVFFRRNAKEGQERLKCDFGGNCEINLNNRHVCAYCRLMKCLSSGMQAEMIRSPYPKTNKTSQQQKKTTDLVKTTSQASVRINQPEQFPILNLLREDPPSPAINQWNLISNLTNCYDEHEHNGLSINDNYIHQQHHLPFKLRYKSKSMMEMFTMASSNSQM